MAAHLKFVKPEHAEIVKQYIGPGTNQGIALVFCSEAQAELEKLGYEDGSIALDYDFGGDPDAYVESVTSPDDYLVQQLQRGD